MKPSAFTIQFNSRVDQLVSDIVVAKPRIDEPEWSAQKVRAIWDTGATTTAITEKLASSLSLHAVGTRTVLGVHGAADVNEYIVDIVLTNQVLIPNVLVTGLKAFVSDCDALIGMDIIGEGDFTISRSPEGNTTMSYVLPSMGEIDLVPIAAEAGSKGG